MSFRTARIENRKRLHPADAIQLKQLKNVRQNSIEVAMYQMFVEEENMVLIPIM
ncbi:MAG TPA: hypothetical protein VI754_00335 [Bacteriovoracaceae bacterium]|nr:hypothetical protein [Bacteriovoracaceae bacterium]